MSVALSAAEPTAAPILDLFERYSGRFLDLERAEWVDSGRMRRWRDDIVSSLAAAGLSAGDRVVLCVGNGAQFPASLVAVLTMGGSPILTHVGATEHELLRLGRDWNARWLLCDDRALPEGAIGLDCGAGLRLRRLAGEGVSDFAGAPLHPTSGTTGLPKLAVRPGAAAVAEAAHYADAMTITRTDRILCVTPMSHAYAYGMAVMVPLLTGADAVCMRAFNPRVAVRALAEEEITIFPAAPAMLPILARSGWRDTPMLRLLLTAGAPLPPDVRHSFAARTGIEPRPLLGTTETGGISVATGQVRPGAVGPPMKGVEVRISPSPTATEGVGLLDIRSSSMMAGYLTPDGIVAGTDAQGWFTTGDLARIGPDEQIELLGRVGDVINVMGHKVLPSEVEAVIATMQDVAEVKVYAGRHHSGGDIVLAAILPATQVDVADIRRHCEQHLATYKRPSHIYILNEMPRTSSGKIVVRDLPQARNVRAEINDLGSVG
jgi:long-chain acyl-CoA synthetase